MDKRMCLVFNTELDALGVEAKISQNKGLPHGKTVRWAVPEQRITDNKWFFEKPNVQCLSGTEETYYTTEEWSDSWVDTGIED